MESINWKKQLVEVIVLIVGILIAFGLNNWWANHKEQAIMQKHFLNLEEENKDNRAMLDTSMVMIDYSMGLIDSIFRNNGRPNAEEKVASWTFELINIIPTYTFKNAYQTLSQTGDIRLINDFDLKQDIIGLYEYYKFIESVDKVHLDFFNTYFYPFLMKNIAFGTRKAMDSSIFSTTQYKNMIGTYSHHLRTRKEVYHKASAFMAKVEYRLEELNE